MNMRPITQSIAFACVALVLEAACGSDKTTTATGVKAPSDLKVVALEGGAHLTWKDNSDNESGFMIERMTSAGAWAPVGDVPFDTTQYHDANLTAGTTYMYRVMAVPKTGGDAAGAYSEEVMFTAPSTSVSAGTGGGSAAAGFTAH